MQPSTHSNNHVLRTVEIAYEVINMLMTFIVRAYISLHDIVWRKWGLGKFESLDQPWWKYSHQTIRSGHHNYYYLHKFQLVASWCTDCLPTANFAVNIFILPDNKIKWQTWTNSWTDRSITCWQWSGERKGSIRVNVSRRIDGMNPRAPEEHTCIGILSAICENLNFPPVPFASHPFVCGMS